MVEQSEDLPRTTRKKLPGSRPLLRFLGILAALALILFVASFFIDEPLRRMTEKKMNSSLKGYSVRLPELHLQLIGLSLTLKGLTVRQQAHPEPPVARFPYLKASVHWREILSGKLVAEFRLDQPELHINLKQLRSEVASEIPLKEKGWQRAVEAIYPLKINLLKVNDAKLTYIDQDPKRPLVLSKLNLRANNIRNIRLPDKVYPSSFRLDTVIFGAGKGSIDGKANFLAEPIPGVKAAIKLNNVPLDYFKPVLARANLTIAGGVLSASGNIENSSKVQTAQMEDVTIDGIKLDYIHAEKTAAAEKKRAKAVGKAAGELSNKPDVLIRVDNFNLTDASLGMVNQAAGNPYRLFLSDADFHMSNFSNQFSRGPAKARLNGKFMGSGVTTATGQFRPEDEGPDFDLYLKIDNTQLVSLNDLLRAYGKFDVKAGTFSLVTELHVKRQEISGYIKPFFKDMKVYDRRQDKEKGIFRKLYEMLVGGVANLLENRPREQVATRADIAGPVANPETSTWQIIIQLIRNAFFKAILPTFERQVTGPGKK